MTELEYQVLVRHYEDCLEKHGPVPKGVDWPNDEDLATRFSVMLDMCLKYKYKKPIHLLDLGCGYGALLDYLMANDLHNSFVYKGIDLSTKMIQVAKQRHTASDFEIRNILTHPLTNESVDYVIMNGLLTEKRSLTQAQMVEYTTQILRAAYDISRIGIAFNVMNFHVDWYRDELFYLSFDDLFKLIKQYLSRHVLMRADYGLYEYIVYVYKKPIQL